MGRLSLLLLVGIITSCFVSSEQTIQKAAETHELAMKISEHVDEKISQMVVFADTMTIDPIFRQALKDSLLALAGDFQEWQSAMIGVPGHEPDSHDHHHHHHHQNPSPDLTPGMILEIQEALRHNIIQLNIRAQRILNRLEQQNAHPEKKEKASVSGA